MRNKFLLDTNAGLNNIEVLDIERQIKGNYMPVVTSHMLREIEHLELTRKQDRTLMFQIRRFKEAIDFNEHIYVDLNDYEFSLRDDWDGKYTDNVLVQICVDNDWGMITNDRLLKMKSKLYGIEVMEMNDNNFIDNKGFKEFNVSERQHEEIMYTSTTNSFDLVLNEYAIINNVKDGELLDIVKWDGLETLSLKGADGRMGVELKTLQFKPFSPKDEYQAMAMDSILHNQITSIRGRAGSGKSIIALNTAWHLVEKESYKLVIFVNPAPSMDAQELGFYKGDRLEKLMQSAVGTMLKSKFGDELTILTHIASGRLDILPFVDLRGYDTGDTRTIVWIVEAQNLTSELMKLGLQRIATNTKVVVDGDYHQQVDKQVYIADNGMKRMSEIFRGTKHYAEIELQNVWRSEIAELADLM